MEQDYNEKLFMKLLKKHEEQFYKANFSDPKKLDAVIFKYARKIFIRLGTSHIMLNNIIEVFEKLKSNKNLDKEVQEKIDIYSPIFWKIYDHSECLIFQYEELIEKLPN